MTPCWLAELSDDELEARLRQVGVVPVEADRLVRHRDSEIVDSFLHDLLEAGR